MLLIFYINLVKFKKLSPTRHSDFFYSAEGVDSSIALSQLWQHCPTPANTRPSVTDFFPLVCRIEMHLAGITSHLSYYG